MSIKKIINIMSSSEGSLPSLDLTNVIVFLWGQSNQINQGIVLSPAPELTGILTGHKMLQVNVLEDIEFGVNHQGGTGTVANGFYGSELRYANLFPNPSYFGKYAVGNTSLEVSWALGTGRRNNLVDYINNLDSLTGGSKDIIFDGNQWEADAAEGFEDNYYDNMVEFFDDIQSRTKPFELILMTAATKLSGAASDTATQTIIDAQNQIASERSNIIVVPVTGVTFTDSVHWTDAFVDTHARRKFDLM